jgi:hypothetical protein
MVGRPDKTRAHDLTEFAAHSRAILQAIETLKLIIPVPWHAACYGSVGTPAGGLLRRYAPQQAA